ncbi:NAD/NADP octopine/nopaline dehydrogenase family protein [Microbacterium sp. MPKO10]|uniref:NAD/NADP octopine/nopaline dehydrogenase family protein n=1 Tax=Microbacterium sp. MPKO10 TaxID=2989818 RepID=UPI00223691E9|nr:NAD/NADP octopine/nopaline dehydrogenase family protein [Microbacterium sp. MPKO10]MCW4459873.1 NAD/NADP octopine/nopaline dehydrogenase family protein [Microbacterium sp. MPKO10]
MLSIIGGPQAISAAVYASANTSEEVGILSPSLPHEELPGMRVENLENPVRLRHGVLPETTHFVVISDSTKLKEVIFAHRQQIAGRKLLLAPGGFAGVLRVRAWFEKWGLAAPEVGEVTAFITGGKRDSAASQFRLGAVKRDLPIAAATAAVTRELHAEFGRYFPNLAQSDLVTTTLSNANHMIHPAVVLLNAARIDNGEPFLFYREGLSPATVRFMEALDTERLELVKALGGETLTLQEWMLRYYEGEGMRGETLLECLQTFSGFAGSAAPTTLRHRYLEDDVWFGLAQYLSLARQRGTGFEHLQSAATATTILCPRIESADDDEPWQLLSDYLGGRERNRHFGSTRVPGEQPDSGNATETGT